MFASFDCPWILGSTILLFFQDLSLAGLSLSGVPSEIWKSSDITKVNLTGNSIEELPSELGSCVSLEVNIR